MSRSPRLVWFFAVFGEVLLIAAGPARTAEAAPHSPPAKEPPIDLQDLAKQPRPGQIMPGRPAPMPTPSDPKLSPPDRTPEPTPAPKPEATPAKAPTTAPATPAVGTPPAPAAAPGAAKPESDAVKAWRAMQAKKKAAGTIGTAARDSTDPMQAVKAGMRREAASIMVVAAAGGETVRRFDPATPRGNTPWQELKSGESDLGVFEYRAGASGPLVLRADGVNLELAPASSARIGRMNTGGEGASASRLIVELASGEVTVVPVAGGAVNVISPDAITVVRERLIVRFDTGRGTTTAMPAPAHDPSAGAPADPVR